MALEAGDAGNAGNIGGQGESGAVGHMAAKYCMAGFNQFYYGLPTEDLDEFIRQFEAHATLANFTGEKKKTSFQTRLKGNANICFNGLTEDEKSSYDNIVKALKDNYQGESWKWQMNTKLLTRKQGTNESIDDFASDIMKLSAQLSKPIEEQMSYFVRGLQPHIQSFVIGKEPKTLKEAIDHARLGVLVEQVKQSQVSSSNIQGNEACTSEPQIHSVQFTQQQSHSHNPHYNSGFNSGYNRGYRSSRGRWQGRRRGQEIVCYRCSKLGHIRRQCTEMFDIHGYSLN